MKHIQQMLKLFGSIVTFLIFGETFAQAPMVLPHPVPDEFTTSYYEVVVNGESVPVFHAGLNVYFVSFDFKGNVAVKVTSRFDKRGYSGETANKAWITTNGNYWGNSPLIRPLSKNIQPTVEGKTLSFAIGMPGQYAVEREGTTGFKDDVLFVFANPPGSGPAQAPGLIYLKAGIHQKHISLTSGQTLFMEPGAVLFGSINVWDAEDVTIAGRGIVVYYGPQSETRDDGWKHLQNWHPLTTHNAKRLSVDGITFVGRSRTWSIQMYNTFNATFNNVKVIAVNPQNINGDGFDWYGGGQTTITNSFVRSMDDCFAFFTPGSSEGMWATDKITSGNVSNVSIDNCVLWTSLANVYRVGFSGQDLNTDNIKMTNCDVIHISKGEWLAPNSIICAVSPNDKGQATHRNYLFENINFEEPCAFLGLQNQEAKFQAIIFKNVMMKGQPTPSLIKSEVDGLLFEKVTNNGRTASEAKDLSIPTDAKKFKGLKFVPTE